MKSLFLTLCAFFATLTVFGQYHIPQNNVWAFGIRAGVDFNSGVPVSISTAIKANEGTASVSDAAGNLLFYTDGSNVWNKVHQKMPHGDTIVTYGTTSTTQGALIVPFMGNENKYYIFSTENLESAYINKCRLSYSVVDMSLDGGFGDIVASSKGTLLINGMSEKMILIPGPCCLWVLAHKANDKRFYAYQVTAVGINPTPVISTVGSFAGYMLGTMKVSHNKQQLAVMSYPHPPSFSTGLELYDFNPATGVVSNCRVINTEPNSYAVEFSPDNSKLYAFNYSPSNIYQYDVSLSSPAAINASKYVVHPITSSLVAMDLKLGPDGKIYMRSETDNYLACINNPNAAGSACNFADSAVFLGSDTGYIGKPNLFWLAPDAITAPSGNFTICLGTTLNLSGATAGGTWSSGSPAVASVSATGIVSGLSAGTANISYTTGCGTSHITVTVGPAPGPIAGPDIICDKYPATFTSNVLGGVWSGGGSIVKISPLSGVATGMHSGTATITYSMGSCSVTKIVTVANAPQIFLNDTLCIGETMSMTSNIFGGSWSSTNTFVASVSDSVLTGVSAGTVVISYVSGNGCFNVDTVEVKACSPSGIDGQFLQAACRIHPNPTSGKLYVSLPIQYAHVMVKLFDLTGRLCLNSNAKLTSGGADVNLDHLPNGNYILQLETDGAVNRSMVTIAKIE